MLIVNRGLAAKMSKDNEKREGVVPRDASYEQFFKRLAPERQKLVRNLTACFRL